jgi:hypothetical protein
VRELGKYFIPTLQMAIALIVIPREPAKIAVMQPLDAPVRFSLAAILHGDERKIDPAM